MELRYVPYLPLFDKYCVVFFRIFWSRIFIFIGEEIFLKLFPTEYCCNIGRQFPDGDKIWVGYPNIIILRARYFYIPIRRILKYF